MSKNRKYSYADITMCLAAKIAAARLRSNLAELSEIRSNWTEQFITDFEINVDDVIKTHLSVDKQKILRDATRILKDLMEPAKIELSRFKSHVNSDYKSNKEGLEEILRNLGLTKNLKLVQQNNQEALIELLFAFRSNMTDELKSTLTSKGMTPSIIEKLIGFAEVISNANINQELFKGTTKELSVDAIEALNGIYDEAMSICTISANYYKSNTVKKEQFTFSKIVANMGTNRKDDDKPTE